MHGNERLTPRSIMEAATAVAVGLALAGMLAAPARGLAASNAGPGHLRAGAVIKVAIESTVSSGEAGTVSAYVVEAVRGPTGRVLIERDAPVEISVERQEARAVGRPGEVSVRLRSVRAVDGTRVALDGEVYREGRDRKTAAILLTVGACLLVGIFGFFGLLLQGEEARIPRGKEIRAGIADSYQIALPATAPAS